MNLENRDYTLFENAEEKNAYEEEKKYEMQKGIKSTKNFPRFSHPDEQVRKFIWHKRSLFPNNYLYFANDIDYQREAKEYREVIYSATDEHSIQQYIKENKKWFIPGSIFLDYGVLLTLADMRTNLARATETSLKENYGKFIKVYQTVIPVAVKAAETSAAGKSIYSYDKDSTVAKAYQAFTKEVVRDGERQRNQLQSSLSR